MRTTETQLYDVYLNNSIVYNWFEADEQAGKVWINTPVLQMGDTNYKVLTGKVEIKVKSVKPLPQVSIDRGDKEATSFDNRYRIQGFIT